MREIEALAEDIGKGIQIPDGTGIVEYLADTASVQSSQINDSYPVLESLFKSREAPAPKSPGTARIIQI